MEPAADLAPPVVAVMIVHDPGPWFDEVLEGLAEQDYANLKYLFLLTSEPGDIPDRVRSKLDNAFVRAIGDRSGYGPAANEVLQLVAGDNGFFCLMHDDVALDSDAIRQLVEELYRSNAGIVGPKLVEWDDPGVLQHVGFAVDRFGEIDPIVEPGELDQEQHDAVRDVFCLPSACLLIRADLFRQLGGFDAELTYYGEDLDLCWRAHLSGARVLVVPAAVGRHREQLGQRRPDLRQTDLRARHRLRAVTTLTGGRRLAALSVQLVVITIAEFVVSVVTGRARQGWAALKALLGLIPKTPGIFARRRSLAGLRRVPDGEVAGLQIRGSARVAAYMRRRDMRSDHRDRVQQRWRQRAGTMPVIAWAVFVVVVIISSRKLITNGVPHFGEFLRFPSSPGDLLRNFRSAWVDHGLGSTSPAPTAYALVALGSVGTLFHMGLLHTLSVVGLIVVGGAGVWNLLRTLPSPRAAVVGLGVYAVVPLLGGALSAGKWGVLLCYAAAPWVVSLAHRLLGDDGFELVQSRSRRRRIAFALVLVVATASAFAPAFTLVAGLVAVSVAVGSAIGGASWRSSVGVFAAIIGAVVAGAVLNLPWAASFLGRGGWAAVVGARPAGPRQLGLLKLASFDIGNARFAWLAVPLYLPVLFAPLIAREWRFRWAVRAASLVVIPGAITVLEDRGSLPGPRLVEPAVLLVPVALGLALAAAVLAAAFEDDVLQGSFGWRQPVGLLCALGVLVGALPGVVAALNGRWKMPARPLADSLGQLQTDPPEGDYRVLWVGDPRLVPVAGWEFAPGVAFAVTNDGPLEITQAWPGRPSAAERAIGAALQEASVESTLRVGRLLAPFGIRYIAVPLIDGALSTVERPLPQPVGLIDALEDQLDLAAPPTQPLNAVLYENTAWLPVRAMLGPQATAISKQAGFELLAANSSADATPVAVGTAAAESFSFDATPGALAIASPPDPRWVLRQDGADVRQRPAFGSTAAFDIAAAGPVRVSYQQPLWRDAMVAGQGALWLLALLGASDVKLRRRWRRRVKEQPVDTPLVSLLEPVHMPDDPTMIDVEGEHMAAGGEEGVPT